MEITRKKMSKLPFSFSYSQLKKNTIKSKVIIIDYPFSSFFD